MVHASKYRIKPKVSDRLVWANNADPDQTAPKWKKKIVIYRI